tara:strand:+ start:503 stop:892 length:390 start_codon:yes stop_codon:yes gene_type:complete
MSTGLLVLLDDIATVLDDVAAMTKIAAGRTARVLGDDLALNAEQVSGVRADRELPVVWAVFMGSARNKLILVPAALLLTTIATLDDYAFSVARWVLSLLRRVREGCLYFSQPYAANSREKQGDFCSAQS